MDSKVRKSILRNTEIPVESSSKREKHIKFSSNGESKKTAPAKITEKKPDFNRFTKPTLNSTLKVVQKMRDVTKGVGFLSSKSNCVTASSAALAQEKLTHQLNFPINKKVFRGLCPVNVNDSVLEADVNQKSRPIRYAVPTHRSERDPEPVLADFLTHVPPCEYDLRESIRMKPHKFRPPICTTLENIETVYDMGDVKINRITYDFRINDDCDEED
uniref:CSON010069 protein n=1 Tax=Culicoides sonorensis TaxID=179676 RepID=A0A336M574_CULSO